MDVGRLLAEEEAGWSALQAAFARVPGDRFEEPTLTADGWSPKGVMFHVGSWLSDCADALAEIAAGTFDRGSRPVELGANTEDVNADVLRRASSMHVEEVRAGCAAARERAVAAFEGLPEVSPNAWEWFEESGPLHYATHEADLRAWLGD
jgi:hypothetical protein